jgi:hypothetical protein
MGGQRGLADWAKRAYAWAVKPLALPWVRQAQREQARNAEMRREMQSFLAVSSGACETVYDRSERLRNTL